jgi:hypothetical protein
MARCQPTWRGVKETSLAKTLIQNLRGPVKCQLLVTPCVSLFLTLFAPGSSDPTGGFYLGTLSFAGPLTIVGPVWDTVTISHAVIAGVMCEE